ncbi:MAG: mandelate racemase, partial [Gemmatimonadetes bacterium]|nr:mandelate racemase [Gemmatimonadota bacterium]
MPSTIRAVAITEFEFTVDNIGLEQAAAGVGNMAYVKGGKFKARRFAVRISTDDGVDGEYVAHWVGTPATLAQACMLAPLLVGRNADQREKIYDDMKRELRAYDHMGHGVLDNALWDLAGKKLGTSVAALLGGFKDRLPTYASTYHAQESPGGLDTPEAFADYAQQCKEQGFHGFKIHGWN